jgi:hypothetical protein
MIGASRTAVALVAGRFAAQSVARFLHGTVRITETAALGRAACECYGIVRREFERLVEWPTEVQP